MLILDMDMPKSCKDCRLKSDNQCIPLRKSCLLKICKEERLPNCPIKAKLPKDATNGDLLLSIFQEKSDCFYPVGTDKMGFAVDVDRWNAPYKE